jgi:Methyltransferase FkbM domain
MILESDLISVGEPWTRLHRRVFDVPGVVIDLGCAMWDWSGRFFGRKPVLGADPFETDPKISGVDLFQGVVTTVRGQVQISRDGIGSSTRGSTKDAVLVEAITLEDLLERYRVTEIAALKINTEGSEYELLINMHEKLLARIDQIAVSFHDFIGLASPRATEAVITFLRHWYDVVSIDERWNWYLFTRRA